MRRETGNILLILLGGALVKLALSGEYLRYVKPVHQPWLLGGGVIMLLLGAVAIVRDLRAPDGDHEHSGEAGEDCGPHEHGTRSAWLLVVPVLTVLLVAPPALGSDSVGRAQGRTAAWEPVGSSGAAFPPLAEGTPALTLSEFAARAGWDETGSLEGRAVRLTGFVVHRGGEVYLARLVIGCCAADANPVTVRLVGERAAEVARLPDDSWTEITGELVPGSASERTGYVAALTVASALPVPEPAEAYEY